MNTPPLLFSIPIWLRNIDPPPPFSFAISEGFQKIMAEKINPFSISLERELKILWRRNIERSSNFLFPWKRASKCYGCKILNPHLIFNSHWKGGSKYHQVQNIMATKYWTSLFFSIPVGKGFKILCLWNVDPLPFSLAIWDGVQNIMATKYWTSLL